MATQGKVANFQDANLVPGNVADGITIYGVTGTLSSGGANPTGGYTSIWGFATPQVFTNYIGGYNEGNAIITGV